jgi:hypothetical protein
MDPLVKVTKVTEVSGIDPQTLAPAQQTVVEYTVGEHGPYKLVTPAKQFTPEYVDAETAKRVAQLRALGLVT